MCGIAGFVELKEKRSPEKNERIAGAMADAIRHRGPDDHGVWSDPAQRLWLSHRRLAIIDLTTAGAQPMETPDGLACICYNGEIYNARDLKPELDAAGYRFRGHSDTEVLLYACHLWGPERAAQRLIGMFAFAYWDGRSDRLTLVRDRVGKKPLYWSATGTGLIFASELLPMMIHPECPRDIDHASVSEYLRTLYISAPNSILAGVSKVEPGGFVTFELGSGVVSQGRYWNLLDVAIGAIANPFTGSPEDAAEEAERLLVDATGIRMISDVPLGALLSGGIDSSVVVAMMARESGSVRTFSIGYSDPEFDESGDAERIAAHLGTAHTTLRIEARDAMAVIPDLPRIFDEPFADVSQIPTYLVSKLAREHVTVALSGDGGDEVFAGYNRHVAANGLLPNIAAIPASVRTAVSRSLTLLAPDQWQSLLNFLPSGKKPRLAGEKLHKLAGLLGAEPREQYRHLVSQWQDPESVIVGGAQRPTQIDDPVIAASFPDRVAHMRYLDLATYLPGDILTKVDRATMAVSLEARAPLLDHRLIEFSFRVPSSTHLRNGESKWLLRRILSRYVPATLTDRPKMGFGVPIGDWLRGPLRPWAEEYLSEQRLESTGLLRAAPIRALWRRHLDGRINAPYQIWPVLMLLAWLDTYSSDARAALSERPRKVA